MKAEQLGRRYGNETATKPLEVAADAVCKTAGDIVSEMADHTLECPPYPLPNTMIGVLCQEHCQVPHGYWIVAN